MNSALLNAIAHTDTPIDESVPLVDESEPVAEPVTKRALGDYLTNDAVRIIVIVNNIYIFGHILGWWD